MWPYMSALRNTPGLDGISLTDRAGCSPLQIKSLFYADDICVLADSPNQLQLALQTIENWCSIWGMEIGIGAGKTEAMAFPTAACPVPVLPILTVNGNKTVQWTSSYRYLGCIMTPSLDMDTMMQSLIRRLHVNYNRFIRTNFVTKQSAPTLCLEILRLGVIGCVNYLLAVLPPCTQLFATIDKLAHWACTWTTYLPHHRTMPHHFQRAWGRFPDAIWTAVRERIRFGHQLLHASTSHTIAGRLMTLLSRDDRDAPRHLLSWYVTSQRFIRTRMGKDSPQLLRPERVPLLYKDISVNAALLTRAPARARFFTKVARDINKSTRERVKRHAASGRLSLEPTGPRTLTDLPRSSPGSRHLDDLLWAGAQHPSLLGPRPTHTALSVLGPYGSGNIGSIVSDPHLDRRFLKTLSHLALGRPGLLLLCSADRSALRTLRGAPAADPSMSTNARLASILNSPSTCPLCNGHTASGEISPTHVLLDCGDPAVSAARALAIQSVPSILVAITALAYKASTEEAAHTADRITAERLRSRLDESNQMLGQLLPQCFRATGAPLSTEERFVLFRLLLAIPWSSTPSAVPSPSILPTAQPPSSLAAALGYLFDHTYAAHHRLRSLANMWVRWAGRNSTTICEAWASAMGLRMDVRAQEPQPSSPYESDDEASS